MDLDDSFTERLLSKNRERKEYLKEIKEAHMPIVGKKRVALVEENQLNPDDPAEESPKRQCTGKLQTPYLSPDKENREMQDENLDAGVSYVPIHTASKVRGLAALKKNFLNDDEEESKITSEQQETPTSVKSPLKPSAETSQKESIEELNKASSQEETSDDESIDEADFTENYNDIVSDHGSDKMEWDYSSKQVEKDELLTVTTKSETATEKLPVSQKFTKSDMDPAELPLAARRALFEKALLGGTPKVNENVIDHRLSVAQRATMFENATKSNSGTKSAVFKEPNRIALSNLSKFDNSGDVQSVKSFVKPKINLDTEKMKVASPVKSISTVATTTVLSPTKNVGNHTRFIQQKLLESSGSNSQEKQVAKVVEERKKEISSLVNHWEKLSSNNVEEEKQEMASLVNHWEKLSSSSSSTTSAEKNSEVERNQLTSEERVSLESNVDQECEYDEESEYEDEDKTEDMNNEIDTKDLNDNQDFADESEEEELDNGENVFFTQQAETGSFERLEDNYYNNKPNVDSVSSSSNNPRSGTSSYSGVSSYTDESSYNASCSQSCSSGSSARSSDDFRSPMTEIVNVDAPENPRSKNPEIPLVYTVSLYRKQKEETRLTPVRTIVRREKVSSPESPPDPDYTEVIQQRLKGLQEEILRQQTIISQTSQALNLCNATVEFSGSTEQVEGERLLLIATQKRQACLNEMTRLKTCGAQGENVVDGTGTLTITDLQLPLKREFIASQLEGKGNDTVHYFLCLIRHGAQVIVTQMMSSDDKTSDGTLSFTNHIQLRDLPADFSVVFEVYALQTKKEILPHEKKYHIKRQHSKMRLTPKAKKGDGKFPAISSPGGPNAVRSPSFGVVGFTRFTLQNCNKRVFTLDKVPFSSPLEGVLRVSLQLHAEHKVLEKGFLTMFEDISGFGAWHRRWCVLDANHIAYWKYPDDEQKREPIGTIDLKQCITDVVKLVSRDSCARPHTFQLVIVRPQAKGDKNTLISRCVNTLTTTKHLLSADTKDERILWCNKLNEALTNVRRWDPHALRPITVSEVQ